jgi:hypothetical protein
MWCQWAEDEWISFNSLHSVQSQDQRPYMCSGLLFKEPLDELRHTAICCCTASDMYDSREEHMTFWHMFCMVPCCARPMTAVSTCYGRPCLHPPYMHASQDLSMYALLGK